MDQEDLLWRRGVELAGRKDELFHYLLYQLDGFYLEVKYTMPQGKIKEIICFEDMALIEIYLEQIPINAVFSILGD